MTMRHCALSAAFVAIIMLCPPAARAQYFLSYSGDTASREIRDSLSLLTEVEQAIDTNHRVLARWLLVVTEGMIKNAQGDIPNAVFNSDLASAKTALERKESKKAIRYLGKAKSELDNLSKVWDEGNAGEKMAECLSRAEKGDLQASLANVAELSALVRVDPLQKCIESAISQVREAKAKHAHGYEIEALQALGSAAHSLRRAYLASRLTQAKLIVTHARLMADGGSCRRAAWTLGRAERRLKKGSYMADSAEADAIAKIAADMNDARGAVRERTSDARGKLEQVEAKIIALLAKIEP
ncbi:MAG: hypothetical protein NTZ78_14445 [Candidatus Aureabacteria bacterium]|nr:hypothetical protein [Candidatus Auribacterota bacterium]